MASALGRWKSGPTYLAYQGRGARSRTLTSAHRLQGTHPTGKPRSSALPVLAVAAKTRLHPGENEQTPHTPPSRGGVLSAAAGPHGAPCPRLPSMLPQESPRSWSDRCRRKNLSSQAPSRPSESEAARAHTLPSSAIGSPPSLIFWSSSRRPDCLEFCIAVAFRCNHPASHRSRFRQLQSGNGGCPVPPTPRGLLLH